MLTIGLECNNMPRPFKDMMRFKSACYRKWASSPARSGLPNLKRPKMRTPDLFIGRTTHQDSKYQSIHLLGPFAWRLDHKNPKFLALRPTGRAS
jgi:hypothetical protein